MKNMNKFFKHLLLLLPIVFLVGCGGSNPANILKKAAAEVNKTCPQRVDDITVLTKVNYVDHCFTYYYELDPDEDSEAIMNADYEVIRSVISAMMKENAANDSNVQSFVNHLRQDNARLVHHYAMKDGRSRDVEVDY